MEQQNLMGYNDNARSLDNINTSPSYYNASQPLQQSGALQGDIMRREANDFSSSYNKPYQLQSPQDSFYKRQLDDLYSNLYKSQRGWDDQTAQEMAVLKAQYDIQHPNQLEGLQNNLSILDGSVEATPEEQRMAQQGVFNYFQQLSPEQQDTIVNYLNYLGIEAPDALWGNPESNTEPTGTQGDLMGGYMQGGFPDTEDNTYSPFDKREGFPSTNSISTDYSAQREGGRMSNKDNMTSMKGGRFARARQNARYNGRM